MACENCGASGSRVVYEGHDKQVYNQSINDILRFHAHEAFKSGDIPKRRYRDLKDYFPGYEKAGELEYVCLSCLAVNEEAHEEAQAGLS